MPGNALKYFSIIVFASALEIFKRSASPKDFIPYNNPKFIIFAVRLNSGVTNSDETPNTQEAVSV